MTTNAQVHTPEAPSPPPAFVNKMMAFLLRSPLHGMMSKTIMLLTFTGRKSGKSYTTPVTYVRQGNVVYCSTGRDSRSWWKNLRGETAVSVRIRGKDLTGRSEVIVNDPEAVADGIRLLLKHVPSDAKYYGVRLDDAKRPLAGDITRSAQTRVLMKIKI